MTYLRRELRRRKRQAVLVAMGLAVGVGLVVTMTAASAGVGNAQGTVLHSLFGIGTDVTVTTASKPPGPGSPGTSKYAFSPGDKPLVVDYLTPVPGLGDLDASAVASVGRLHGVAADAGGLALSNIKFTVPSKQQEQDWGLDGSKPMPASAVPSSINVDGVEVAKPGLGPYASAELDSGRSLAASDADADVVVVDSIYASAHELAVGSKIIIAKTTFTVVGLTHQSHTGGAPEAYIPLARAQALAESPVTATYVNRVNRIYVKATSASALPAVQADISRLLPSATVTSSANLADQVTGSLASVAGLAHDFSRWISVAALLTAFAVASLLTMAAVSRRVREFGTLKALGWRSRRIVAQIIGESAVTGIAGAALGVAVGFGGTALVDAIAPTLSATVSQNPNSEPPISVSLNNSGPHRSVAPDFNHTIAVHLHSPVTFTTIALAVALAVAGALIAGSFGAWRAARLRPTQALSRAG